MTKKRVSGQTTAIIVLAILLISTVVFGGVFAYYSASANKISGKITMANLKIEADQSSEILITSGVVVPGQSLGNTTPLTITNKSNAPIYLAVVYSVKVYNLDDVELETEVTVGENALAVPLIDVHDDSWNDYLFTYTKEDLSVVKFRYLIKPVAIQPSDSPEGSTITVVEKDKLSLHKQMGNDYQAKSVVLSFQAYAIGSEGIDFSGCNTVEERCNKIMLCIYQAFSYNISI